MGSNIGQILVPLVLLSIPLVQVETGGEQAIVSLLVPVTLLSTPVPQGSETGGEQDTLMTPLLIVLVTLLSLPLSHVPSDGVVELVVVELA